MTKNSKISQIMCDHISDWREYFKKNYPDIKIKEDDYFALFKYAIQADFKDPVVQEARGIILDINTFDVVCWPFRKFGKYDESYADIIDWSTARIEEKIDGSIIKYWYNPYTKEYQWSTGGMINAKDALTSMISKKSFLDIIMSTEEYKILKNTHLSKDYTYIFELVSPETQVVIKYPPHAKLTLIGIRNNITGKEVNPHDYPIQGIANVYVYSDLNSLDDCINYFAEAFDNIASCLKEGFVVVDDNFNRIKVKSPEYIALHGLATNTDIAVKRILKLLYNKRIDLPNVCEQLPKLASALKYYDFMLSYMIDYIERTLFDAREFYKQNDCNNKLLAEKLKGSDISPIIFFGINNNLSARDIIDEMNIKGQDRGYNFLQRLIPKYRSKEVEYFEEG